MEINKMNHLLGTTNKKKPLGKLAPWAWSVEFVRGCNLKCWHCTAEDLSGGEPQFMPLETWESMCKIMANMTPYRRLELAQGGEPTLHPHLIECLKIAKKITPTTQIQVTTNGLSILSGKFKFKQLFDAGANSVYIDMYTGVDKFIDMAKTSGAEWYKYDQPKKIASSPDHLMANNYYNKPDMKLIILQDNPEYRLRWRKSGRLSTFLNHTNWEKCLPYGLTPVREPYQRKCTLPMRYSSLSVHGDYLFCCIDFWCESAGLLGNVSDGMEGFKEYWFGRLMQSIRRQLKVGNRMNIPYCSRCNCAFSKCDWVNMWPSEAYENFYNGQWSKLLPIEKDNEIFADGWKWYKKTMRTLPSEIEEQKILSSSNKRIIHSGKAIDKKSKIKQGALFVFDGDIK